MRRHRCFLPSEVYFITIRTVEERYALHPLACPGAWSAADGRGIKHEARIAMNERGRACVKETNALAQRVAQFERGEIEGPLEVSIEEFTNSIPNIIGSCLARAVEQFGVRLYGVVWMSNHGHLLLRAPKDNLPEFMTYLNGQIALEVNRFLGRRHQLWARRYAAAPVLDEAMELELLGYILTNPQNAGLVKSIEKWPGLSSAPYLLKNQTERFLRFNRTAWHEHGRPKNIGPFLSTTTLEHALLPQLETLENDEMRAKIRKLLRQKKKPTRLSIDSLSKHPNRNSGTSSPRRRLECRAIIPTDRPQSPKRSPQPLCHTTNPALRERHKEWHRAFRAAYAECSNRYKNGEIEVEFPPGAFAPSRYPAAHHAANPDQLLLLHPTRTNLEFAAARTSNERVRK